MGRKGDVARVAEPQPPIIVKAVVYITHTDPATGEARLVVFDHADHPAAGTQVPAGTVEDGEDVGDAALREAYEETGLEGIRLVGALGTEDVDLRPYGMEGTARRHFFHAAVDGIDGIEGVDGAHRERWPHVEAHRSDGGPPVTFELRWAPLASPPALAGELGARLSLVQAALVPDVAAVIATERAWVEAHRRMDVEAIARLMADDYSSLREDGAVWGRAETLAAYVPGERHWDEAESDRYHVRVNDDTAVLVARWRARGVNNDQAFDYAARFTAVYVRRGEGRWLLMHDHSTEMR